MTSTSVEQINQLQRVSQQLEQQSAEQSQLTKVLKQIEEKYRTFVEQALEGICQIAPDGRLIGVNPALARIYGYASADQLVTSLANVAQIYVDAESYAEFIQQLLLSDAFQQREAQIYRQNGSIIWILEKTRAIRNDRGAVLYYESFVEEITHQKQLEYLIQQQTQQLKETQDALQQTQAQLIQAEKLSTLGQLLAGVAHEINNPVGFVCGNLVHTNQYTQDLLGLLGKYQHHYPCPPEEIQDEVEAIDLDFLLEDLPRTLSSIQIGADRIRQIVLSLRNFSRADESICQPADIHEGIDNTLLILRNHLKATSQRPEISIVRNYSQLPPVECYAGQLNQVFMNILSNAVDALETSFAADSEMNASLPSSSSSEPCDRTVTATTLQSTSQPKPTIFIHTVQLNPDWIVIRIADNGPGLDSYVKQKIFNPFFTTKPVGKGTGLGLSISYQIVVEKHGGKLDCVAAPGKGTEFIIQIPLKHQGSLE